MALRRSWKLRSFPNRPQIDRTFPLDQTAQAHAYGETGRARGKVVIRIIE